MGFFPDRRTDFGLSTRDRPYGGRSRTGRTLHEGTNVVRSLTTAAVGPNYTKVLRLDLARSSPSGRSQAARRPRPAGPHETIVPEGIAARLKPTAAFAASQPEQKSRKLFPVEGDGNIGHGAVVIALITSCTNTSNPSVMLGAGPSAKKAAERTEGQTARQDQPVARQPQW